MASYDIDVMGATCLSISNPISLEGGVNISLMKKSVNHFKAKLLLFPPLAPQKMVTPYHTVLASSQNRVKLIHSRLYFCCMHFFITWVHYQRIQ